MSIKSNKISSDRDLAILVSSCDQYRDLWSPFFTLFWRYWSDCPFKVCLITNFKNYPDARVTSVCVGEDRHWASNIRIALNEITEPMILYMQEDYLLMRKVENKRIFDLIAIMKQLDAAYLRLYPCPGPDIILDEYPGIGLIRKGVPYRTSQQAAVWRKDVLQSLLVDGETMLETHGSRRSDKLEMPFLSVVRDNGKYPPINPPICYFCTAILRGKWLPAAVKFCRKEGIEIDLSVRRVRSWMDDLWEDYILKMGAFILHKLNISRNS